MRAGFEAIRAEPKDDPASGGKRGKAGASGGRATRSARKLPRSNVSSSAGDARQTARSFNLGTFPSSAAGDSRSNHRYFGMDADAAALLEAG